MTVDSNEQDKPSSSGGAREFSQADVDALLGGSPPPEEAEPMDESGAAPQSENTSAQPSDAETAARVSADNTEVPKDAEVQTTGAVTQDDIELLMKAAGAGDDDGAKGAGGKAPPAVEAGASRAAPSPLSIAPDGEDSVSSPPTRSFEFQSITNADPVNVDPKRVTMLNDVNLRVRLQLGRTRMLLEDVLQLGEGSVVELDKLAGDPVDVLVNDRLVARGEVLVLNDVFCVRVCEVLSNDPHRITV